MNYVVAAYAVTILAIGGYILSIWLRRRATERELAAWLDAGGAEGAAAGEAWPDPALDPSSPGDPR